MKQAKLIDQLLNGSSDDPQHFRMALTAFLDQIAAEDQLRSAWTVFTQVHRRSVRGPLSDRSRQQNICLQEIARRFSSHSIGAWAAVRHQAFETSVEQRLLRSTSLGRVAEQSASMVQPASVAVSPFQDLQAVAEMPRFAESNGFGGVRQASSMIPVGVGRPEVVSPAIREEAVQPAARVDLQLEFHPAVILSRLAKDRQVDTPAERSELREAVKLSDASEVSSSYGDLQRIADQGTPDWKRLFTPFLNTRPLVSGRSGAAWRTGKPPRLDGRLDDPCWNLARPLLFEGDLDASPMKVYFAFDDQYLYVAAQCPATHPAVHPAANRVPADPIGVDDEGAANRNVRDQQIDDIPRLKLHLDTDADLWTSHCIEVTDQGRTRDTIDGDPSWQPTWYVDVRRANSLVTFEMAIDRKDISTHSSDDLNNAWLVRAQWGHPSQQATSGLFPSPDGWRSVRFDQHREKMVPSKSPLRKLPVGPVRLAPVRLAPVK
jgi:hypothetical protein